MPLLSFTSPRVDSLYQHLVLKVAHQMLDKQNVTDVLLENSLTIMVIVLPVAQESFLLSLEYQVLAKSVVLANILVLGQSNALVAWQENTNQWRAVVNVSMLL